MYILYLHYIHITYIQPGLGARSTHNGLATGSAPSVRSSDVLMVMWVVFLNLRCWKAHRFNGCSVRQVAANNNSGQRTHTNIFRTPFYCNNLGIVPANSTMFYYEFFLFGLLSRCYLLGSENLRTYVFNILQPIYYSFVLNRLH